MSVPSPMKNEALNRLARETLPLGWLKIKFKLKREKGTEITNGVSSRFSGLNEIKIPKNRKSK